MKIIEITDDDWKEYKKIRLRALADSPLAFYSSVDEEIGLSKKEWIKRLRESNAFRVFAEDKGKLVGKMEVEWDIRKKVCHAAEVYGIYIDPEYRGKGIGKKLMNKVEKLAGKHGVTKLWLDVVVTQVPAINLYKKLGFKKVGKGQKAIRVNGKYYDKLMMEKLL